MRSDLRKLLSRHRAGMIRRSVLEEAVDEACTRLVSERFREGSSIPEGAPFVQGLLVRFEDRIADARQWVVAGELRRAVEAVEEAERVLSQAQKAGWAERECQAATTSWRKLSETYALGAFPELATVRVAERSLEVAQGFLATGESRKAWLVARQLRLGLGRLARQEEDAARRKALVRRLVAEQQAGGARLEELVSTAGRLAAAGLLELAQRLVEDWQAAEGGAGVVGSRGGPGWLPAAPGGTTLLSLGARFGEIERQASRLASILEEFSAANDPEPRNGAAATETETEVV
ncbi:MAG: hypothetical protein ACLF0P_01750 [Thermoanaerobaculia bacterium]